MLYEVITSPMTDTLLLVDGSSYLYRAFHALPGLGPKRVRALYDELHVHTLPQLLRAARDQRIRSLPGFGAASEQRIAHVIV